MKILVACEFSGRVRDAFIARGHDAYSCDLLESETPGPHLIGDARDYLDLSWDMLIAHPPCTYLTNAGVRHLHDHVLTRSGKQVAVSGSKRWVAMFDGAKFFNDLKNAPIERICIENPIPHKYARALIGDYSQIIQPWQFGHGETKATCLWLKGLPKLVPTNRVSGREARVHREAPGPERWKNRSRTFKGIAEAMAAQWGGELHAQIQAL